MDGNEKSNGKEMKLIFINYFNVDIRTKVPKSILSNRMNRDLTTHNIT